MNIDKLKELLQGSNIEVYAIIENNKASETYIKTRFIQDDGFEWETYVPFKERRAGLDIQDEEELTQYLISLKKYFTQQAMEEWRKEQLKNGLISGEVTSQFFKVLLSFKKEFENFPTNPNSARRIQDIKEAGYTIASVERGKGLKGYGRIMLPIPLHTQSGYETFTPQFKARGIRLLKERNAFEAKVTSKRALIPDHKFSEVRWDGNTKEENSMDMTDEEIIQKFQLLDNQRNQQKREVCRRCFQEGIRGTIFGIDYFYKGFLNWDKNIPQRGKQAEKGCIGCPWYDIEAWRKHLNERIKKQC